MKVSRYDLAAIASFVLTVAAGLYGLSQDVALTEHECLVAETAREMTESGDWIVPRFAGAPRVRKTPLGYWSVAAAALITGGVDERTARLPSLLAGWGTLLCVWSMARLTLTPRQAAVAAFAGACAVSMIHFSQNAMVDMQLTFWCALCYLLFVVWMRRRGLLGTGDAVQAQVTSRSGRLTAYAMYVAFAIAMLAKAPMAGIVVGVPLAVFVGWQLVSRRWAWREWWALRPVAGVLIFIAMVAPWFVLVARRVEGFWEVVESENLERFSGELRGDGAARWFDRPWEYLLVLAVLALPWTASLPAALAAPFQRRHAERRGPLLCYWLWLVVSLLILTVAGVKRDHYLLPAMPAALLLLAVALDDFFLAERPRPWAVRGATTAVCASIGIIGGAAAYVSRARPDWRPIVLIGGAAAVLGVLAASVCYARQRRALSLACVGVTAVGLIIGLRPVVGTRFDARPDAVTLRELVKRSAPDGQAVQWLGRPDARLVFYGRLGFARLDDPVTFLRTHDEDAEDVAERALWTAQRMAETLRRPKPVWVLVEADDVERLRRFVRDVPFREVGRMSPRAGTTVDGVALVTNVAAEPAPQSSDGERPQTSNAPAG